MPRRLFYFGTLAVFLLNSPATTCVWDAVRG